MEKYGAFITYEEVADWSCDHPATWGDDDYEVCMVCKKVIFNQKKRKKKKRRKNEYCNNAC